MINFLHTFNPDPTILSFGPLNIYYYGVLIVLSIILGSFILFRLGKPYGLDKDTLIDSSIYVVIAAIATGRLYHILLELPYYIEHPFQTIMLWRGGLAIHGAMIGGIAAIIYFARKKKIDAILLVALYVPALALGQAIGRWGNYFNQELFGYPTDLPWGIPIRLSNRIAPYTQNQYFHPTFLYESIGNLLIFLILYLVHKSYLKKERKDFIRIIALYIGLYSILRFILEFIRIDQTPVLLGLRWPQYASLALITLSIIIFFRSRNKQTTKEEKTENTAPSS